LVALGEIGQLGEQLLAELGELEELALGRCIENGLGLPPHLRIGAFGEIGRDRKSLKLGEREFLNGDTEPVRSPAVEEGVAREHHYFDLKTRSAPRKVARVVIVIEKEPSVQAEIHPLCPENTC
jgi:hypothetical protein